MTSLLHLDSSADCSGGSLSRELTALFAATWRERHEGGEYRYRDLVADPVPPLDSAYCALGRRVERHGSVPPERVAALAEGVAERAAWELTRPLIAELRAAGTVVIGAPMYNFTVTASLKAWIDRVTFPGAFEGAGLLNGKRVVVISTRGGGYGPGTPQEANDFVMPYLRGYFGRLGVTGDDLRFVCAELTLAELAPHLASLRPAAARSREAARVETTALAAL